VVRWVLSFGPDCRAVEPKELVEAVAQSASDTASQYCKQQFQGDSNE